MKRRKKKLKLEDLGPIGCVLVILFFPLMVIWKLMKEYE